MNNRIGSVDAVRGALMVFMLLDHTRDFTHAGAFFNDPLDPASSTPILYLTRWITHLCAPGFVFLAGMGAGLQLLRGTPVAELARFLWTRGLWLALLELTLFRVLIWWDVHPSLLAMLQVIWAIGIGMVVLSALVKLGSRAVLAIGALIVVGHNLLDRFAVTPWRGPGTPVPSPLGKLWIMFHQGGLFPIADFPSPILLPNYPVLPWFGILALGYGFAEVYSWPDERRRRLLLALGPAMLAAFLVLRHLNGYGDPRPWAPQADAVRTAMSFFNVQKYPPSLLFALATLGWSILALGLLEGRQLAGGLGRVLVTFGRVPLFFYCLQWAFAHLAGIAITAVQGESVAPYFMNVLRIVSLPEQPRMGGPLWTTHAAWILGSVLLYFPCRWFAELKARRRDWWLSYL